MQAFVTNSQNHFKLFNWREVLSFEDRRQFKMSFKLIFLLIYLLLKIYYQNCLSKGVCQNTNHC
jgi:hypothetical protein